MGRKLKYKSDTERKEAQRKQRMDYYNRQNGRFAMKTLKEMKEMKNVLWEIGCKLPANWLELILKKMETDILREIKYGGKEISWDGNFQCYDPIVKNLVFEPLNQRQLDMVVDALKEKGYIVNITTFSAIGALKQKTNIKISGWFEA